MGKRNRRKEAGRVAACDALSTVLRAHTGRPEAVPETYADFSIERRRALDAFAAHALRAPEDWRCRIKSRAEDRRFVDLVRFCFARYSVAPHLEAVWLADIADDFVDRVAPLDPRAPRPWGRPDLRAWAIIVGQGGSLYRQAAQPYLTRLETHHFLNAPPEIASAGAAFWYAFARANTGDTAAALRVARSKLDNFSVASSFWKEAARFFARERLATAEIDDLTDFLLAAKRDDEAFALKGRGLAALRRRMEEWHRALRKEQAICGGAWPGRPIPDADYRTGGERKAAIWRFRQIKTGNDLFREGQRMRHCVVTYKHACQQGAASIWSLTCEFPLGQVNKGVTLEVRADGTIVQCRGFANRLPYANEVAMVKRWADDHGLTWRAIG
jgi:PcfJ-like protein